MTTGLKTTLLASASLAGLLNIVQLSANTMQRAQAMTLAAATDVSLVKPVVITKATTVTPVASPVSVAPISVPVTPAVPAAPASPSLTAAQASLTRAGLKAQFAPNYLTVQAKTGTPWQLLAAVHEVETGQSGDTSRTSYAGAAGPMQFMPATFAHYAQDGDGNGTASITDFDDALLTAGRYLAAGGADKGKYSAALYNYNHSNAYVGKVLGLADRLGL